jgi:hypothetical protein
MSLYLSPITFILQQVFTNNGVMAQGGQATIYVAGSTDLAVTYTDSTGVVENPNPITLSSTGRIASASGATVSVWAAAGSALTLIVNDNQGNQLIYLPFVPLINDPLATGNLQSLLASAASSNIAGTGPVAGADLVANALKTYQTFAAVRSANAPILVTGQTLTASVQGAISANDGLGGFFYWNPTSAANDNGATVLKPTSAGSTGRWIRLGLPPVGALNSITAASTTDLGTLGSNVVQINGSTGITSFGSSASTSSPLYFLNFAATPLLSESGNLILPGGVNIQAAAGDFAIALFLGGSSWIVLDYQRASSSPSGDTYLFVPSDQSTTTNAIGVNITGLSAVLAPGTYRVKLLQMMLGTGGTSQGYKYGINFSGTLGNQGMAGVASSNLSPSYQLGNVTSLNSVSAISSTSGSPDVVNVDYIFQVTGAGTANAQLAQASSSSNATTIKQGSTMIVTRIT